MNFLNQNTMILLPIAAVEPYINSYYMTFPKGELLGFIPCSSSDDYSKYYSVETTKGSRVVPVFFIPEFKFDSDNSDDNKGPVLFFHGCDDGHIGLKFTTKEDALKWIDEYPLTDYELILELDAKAFRAGQPTIGFFYHN
jgi:hypothetical protein